MKILIILASGIGNSILFSPTLKQLRKNYPKAQIDIFAYKEAFAEPFKGSKLINRIFYYKGLKTIIKLRKEKYNVSITAFPSNKLQFNVFAYLAGAKTRLTHSYKIGKLSTLAFLQNKKIQADETLHDVEQNLNLLKILNIKLPKKEKTELYFHITKENTKFADNFIKQHNLTNKYLVGVHAGCNKNQSYRRWPKENFVELINKLNSQKKSCLLFSGPDELEEINNIYDNLNNKKQNIIITEKNIKNVASLISKCKYFISTDSGLGHIAVAMKVPTLAIFGPAQASRTKPYGKYGNYVSLNLSCSPCLKYPFTSTSSKINCKNDFRCLREINSERVIRK